MEYVQFHKIPEKYMASLQRVHENVFGEPLSPSKLQDRPQFLALLAIEHEQVVAFKFGYEVEQGIFYSWLGGVDPTYRRQGIAIQLMNMQHSILTSLGYEAVRTYSRNERKEMLIVNLKAGFDIVDTFTDHKGRHKIVLEKCLKKVES